MSGYREAFASALGLLITWSAALTGGTVHLNNEGRILGSLLTTSVQEIHIETPSAEENVDFEAANRLYAAMSNQVDEAIQIEDPETLTLKNLQQKAAVIAEQTPLDLETSEVLLNYAARFSLKPSLILAIIELESNFNPTEVGTHQDRGLMQIIPSTERWLAKDMGHEIGLDYNPKRIFDPEYNIGLAATYLAFLKDAYGENYHRILSEYNRGPYNLARYYQRNGTYATSYSKKVLKLEAKYVVYND